MKRLIILACLVPGVIALAGFSGCAVVDQRDQRELEAAYGRGSPRWIASYADEVISPGADWMIYVKGLDPDGDLQFIQVWMTTRSRTATPLRLVIDSDQRERLSGYLLLSTAELKEHPPDLFGEWVRLSLYMEDRADHVSESVEFFLQFRLGQKTGAPPRGAFDEKFLGRIPVELFPEDSVEGFPVWP